MLTKFKNNLLPLSIALSATLLAACDSDDKNSAPELVGETNPIVAENTVLVSQYTATDADNDAVTLTLDDSGSELFSIDSSGELSFKVAPDYDEGEVGPFNVTIIATDEHELATELSISVTVGDVKDTPSIALVQTIAPDYSNSTVDYLNPKTEQVDTGYYTKDASDYTISSYKGEVFHIGRFFIDTITKYNGADESARDIAVWSYTTQDSDDSTSRNPYALVSLNETKAYLLRYGSSKVWIVNPQATTEDNFKIGELDLTSYIPEDNTKGTPSPAAAVINDGKLYIAMQRLSDTWTPGTAYLAVFDTATDSEIETNANDQDNVKGIPLVGVNPLENSITTNEDKVYVTTNNTYSATDLSYSRIEEINTGDYSLREVLNAGDITDNTEHFITSSAIVSAEQGYFIATRKTESWEFFSALYQFNPTTGEITASKVAETGSENINFIGLDEANFLWVSVANPEQPGVDLINTKTNEKHIARLPTILNPGTIRFIEE